MVLNILNIILLFNLTLWKFLPIIIFHHYLPALVERFDKMTNFAYYYNVKPDYGELYNRNR